MSMMATSQANALLVDHGAMNAGKESAQGPGPYHTIRIHQWTEGGRNPRIAKLGVKGVDIHPEVLWTAGETGTSTATEAVGGQGVQARVGIEAKSSGTGNL